VEEGRRYVRYDQAEFGDLETFRKRSAPPEFRTAKPDSPMCRTANRTTKAKWYWRKNAFTRPKSLGLFCIDTSVSGVRQASSEVTRPPHGIAMRGSGIGCN
jgi:hypothetical protein